MTTKNSANEISSDFLVRGSDYLAHHPGFKLIDREVELKEAATALMRSGGNSSLIMVGQNGVGTSSIILGLQAGKEDGTVPVDIISKRLCWLDTDALFSSGDPQIIRKNFDAAMATLRRAPDTVLVIEDVKDFLDGIRDNGVKSLLNTLMRELRTNPGLQAILESRDEGMKELLESHSDLKSYFTIQEVHEPGRKALREILASQVVGLEAYHGIKIADDVVDTLVDIAFKYPAVMQEITAQPKRSMMILEGALTDYRHESHLHPPHLKEMTDLLAVVTAFIEGKPNAKLPPALEGKPPEVLTKGLAQLKENIASASQEWETLRKKVLSVYKEQRKGEDLLLNKDEEIEKLRQREELEAAQKKKEAEEARKGAPPSRGEYTQELMAAGLSSSSERRELEERRAEIEAELNTVKEQYKSLIAEMNEGLVLTSDHILAEFSRISGLSLSKLTEDSSLKMLNLGTEVKKRVFAQDEAVDAVVDYILNGAAGLKPENKPVGNFLFVGPTGVGKTELVKALAEQLYGDENAMTRFDMGGYQEKNSVTTLVGAPRGYEGYAEGGLLTNAVRRKPNSIVLFDEVEKAHKEIFDLLLPVFDDGILTDTRGLTATFGGVINVMTSNLGAGFFQDPNLTYDQAKVEAMKKVRENFRPEFLGRLDGIFFFKNLEDPQIVLIAKKEIAKLGKYLEKKEIIPDMQDPDIAAMVADHNNKQIGGRGIRNYIDGNVKPLMSKMLLKQGTNIKPGTIKLVYNAAAKKPEASFVPRQTATPKPAAA